MMIIPNVLLRTGRESATDSNKYNNRNSYTILEIATTSRSNRISDKSWDRRGIDEGGRCRCRHEAISNAYNVWAQVPLRRYRRKVVTLAKVMTLVGGQTRSGT